MILKSDWRKILIERRKAISKERREEASHLILEKLKNSGRVLSFTPIGSEIDVRLLNQYLQSQKRLFLIPYRLDSLVQAPLSEIDCILVPGLGFDHQNFRLGYGKGYYDRFLAQDLTAHTIGVGFKEQYCEELLPRDPWDIPVHEVLLF